MEILETLDLELIKSIITFSELFKLVYGKEQTIDKFEVDPTFTYLLVKEGDKNIGCFQVKPFSNTLIEGHSYLLPEHWNTGKSKEFIKLGHSSCKEKGYKKIFCKIPANCTHVLKCLQRIGYTVCGMIEKGVIHNGYLCSLFFYEFDLTKEEV